MVVARQWVAGLRSESHMHIFTTHKCIVYSHNDPSKTVGGVDYTSVIHVVVHREMIVARQELADKRSNNYTAIIQVCIVYNFRTIHQNM